jgi:ABC-type sugar transport system ATPase subunit
LTKNQCDNTTSAAPPVTYDADLALQRAGNVDIASEEFLVLVGPSGCGKSTLLRMIVGFEDISGGTLDIGGRVINDLPPAERDSPWFQDCALYPQGDRKGRRERKARVRH